MHETCRCQSSCVVAHETARVANMEDPTQRFCEIIRRVDDSWDVVHDNVAGILPILNSKVTRAFCTYSSIDHEGGGLVVNINGSRVVLRETELVKNGSKILSVLGSKNGCKELRFCRQSCGD